MNEETLVDYIEGRLGKRDRIEVERHLSESASSLESLLILEEVSRTDILAGLSTAPAAVTEKALRIALGRRKKTRLGKAAAFLGQFILGKPRTSAGRSLPWSRMQFSPIRGTRSVIDANLIAMRAGFAEFDIRIEVDKIGPDTANLSVVLIPESAVGEGARASLLKNARETASHLFQGNAVFFEDIPFGRYTLVIAVNGSEKARYPFEIKESRRGRQ